MLSTSTTKLKSIRKKHQKSFWVLVKFSRRSRKSCTNHENAILRDVESRMNNSNHMAVILLSLCFLCPWTTKKSILQLFFLRASLFTFSWLFTNILQRFQESSSCVRNEVVRKGHGQFLKDSCRCVAFDSVWETEKWGILDFTKKIPTDLCF